MKYLNTIQKRSKHFTFPVEHWEMNEPLTRESIKEICKITKEIGIKFVQLSSDSVFDGTKNLPYIETDDMKSINYYGKTKIESERIVLENPNNCVVRASVLYGYLSDDLAKIESSSKKSINFGQWLITKLILYFK